MENGRIDRDSPPLIDFHYGGDVSRREDWGHGGALAHAYIRCSPVQQLAIPRISGGAAREVRGHEPYH